MRQYVGRRAREGDQTRRAIGPPNRPDGQKIRTTMMTRKAHLSKPYQEIWHELRGTPIYPVTAEKKTEYRSIGKTKKFTPPSTDRAFVRSQLSKNVEKACINARRYSLRSDLVFVFLKTQDYRYRGLELPIKRPVNVPVAIMRVLEARLDELFVLGLPYRATGALLMNLESQGLQQDLFGEHAEIEPMEKIHDVRDVDRLRSKSLLRFSSWAGIRADCRVG